MIPWQIREAISGVARWPDRRAAGVRRSGIVRAAQDDPVLGFGGVLDGARLIHGGAVKLLHLRQAFSHSETEFNILYLVSSAPPEFAQDLVGVCRRHGIFFVWNQNGVGYPGWAGREAERHNAPMRRLHEEADYVIYQSEFCRECAGKFLGPGSAAHTVLFNPVDLEKFHPPAEPLPFGPLRLLALGTHNYAERVLSTIQCLKSLRDAGVESLLTIAGRQQWTDGETEVRREIERLKLGGFVSLLPPFSQDEAAELYRAHHLLLHPKYLDPCPTVVIEALASGLPVVGSASGGMKELVPAECGALVPAPLVWDRLLTPSGVELAAAVQKILPRLTDFSAAARRHAEWNFDAGDWVQKHREIFAGLLR